MITFSEPQAGQFRLLISSMMRFSLICFLILSRNLTTQMRLHSAKAYRELNRTDIHKFYIGLPCILLGVNWLVVLI